MTRYAYPEGHKSEAQAKRIRARKRAGARPIPRPVLKALWRAQWGRCPYCPAPLEDPLGLRGYRVNGDHVIPRGLNGPDAVGNLVCAHADCNHRKADRPPYGCELVFLMAVNARLGVGPTVWRAAA